MNMIQSYDLRARIFEFLGRAAYRQTVTRVELTGFNRTFEYNPPPPRLPYRCWGSAGQKYSDRDRNVKVGGGDVIHGLLFSAQPLLKGVH